MTIFRRRQNEQEMIGLLNFSCDYLEGAHPAILQRLAETNMEKAVGYGDDPYCVSARKKIRAACRCPEADVFFLSGGTQTNLTVISALLRPFEGVLSAQTGHIESHEAGAVEATGHKVLTLPQHEGKLSAHDVEQFMQEYLSNPTREHLASPGMVYISHPTEYGTLYSKAELSVLSEVCRRYQLSLFLDGARLGYGLAARNADLTLEDLASLCDVFYIGGTKVGALCGEAIVIPQAGRIPHFFTMMKQRGALLAKGRLLGIQFDTLFTGNLYLEISSHAIDMAHRLKEGLLAKGYHLYLDSPTNQQFLILENTRMERLARDVAFSFWERIDDTRSVIRLATSWATRPEEIDALLALL